AICAGVPNGRPILPIQHEITVALHYKAERSEVERRTLSQGETARAELSEIRRWRQRNRIRGPEGIIRNVYTRRGCFLSESISCYGGQSICAVSSRSGV